MSFVDFNRTGVPLIEIVSEPDMRTPEEAFDYLKGLRKILLYLEICDGNMEEGSLRCDANVSLRPVGHHRVRHQGRDQKHELLPVRQSSPGLRNQAAAGALRADGEKSCRKPACGTRPPDQTVPMRGKEEAHDYRYFPDPDLVPVKVDGEWIESLGKKLPELPGGTLPSVSD